MFLLVLRSYAADRFYVQQYRNEPDNICMRACASRKGVAHISNTHSIAIIQLTKLVEILICAGDVGVKLVVIANREYGSVDSSQLVDVSRCDIPKSDVPST